jgi:ABC-type transport system involved in multi-copper enzyme maturation permease subunit
MTPRPSFRGLLRAELRKLVHQRANYVMVGGVAALLGLFIALFAVSPGYKATLASSPDGFLRAMVLVQVVGMNTMSGVVMLVAGARLVGMEYTDGTIRVVLARGAGRLRFLAAKLVALAVLSLALLVVLGLVGAASVLGLAAAWHVGPPTRAAWAVLMPAVPVVMLSMGACLLLAAAAAVAGRSTAFAAGVAMAFFPADNTVALFSQLLHSDVLMRISEYLLGPNLTALPNRLMGDSRIAGTIAGRPLAVDSPHILLVVGLWCAGFLALAVVLTWRRDVLD